MNVVHMISSLSELSYHRLRLFIILYACVCGLPLRQSFPIGAHVRKVVVLHKSIDVIDNNIHMLAQASKTNKVGARATRLVGAVCP